MKRLTWAIAIIIIIVVAILIFNYRGSTGEKPLPSQSPKASGEILKGMKLYKDDAKGFEFQYPENWEIVPGSILEYGPELKRIKFSAPEEPMTIKDEEFDVADKLNVDFTTYECDAFNEQTNFDNPYAKADYFWAEPIEKTITDSHQTEISYTGCYECYEQSEAFYKSLETINSVSSITCNSANTACLNLTTKNLSGKYESDRYLMDLILKTVKFDPSFDQLQCFTTAG